MRIDCCVVLMATEWRSVSDICTCRSELIQFQNEIGEFRSQKGEWDLKSGSLSQADHRHMIKTINRVPTGDTVRIEPVTLPTTFDMITER